MFACLHPPWQPNASHVWRRPRDCSLIRSYRQLVRPRERRLRCALEATDYRTLEPVIADLLRGIVAVKLILSAKCAAVSAKIKAHRSAWSLPWLRASTAAASSNEDSPSLVYTCQALSARPRKFGPFAFMRSRLPQKIKNGPSEKAVRMGPSACSAILLRLISQNSTEFSAVHLRSAKRSIVHPPCPRARA
ncbi:hypothetical protein EJ03DRAFT_57455 [Teratosphaeria nubilosa]|uniref:Uncharacterized protein n=1 Tax=Teratosphaeria nubilosa TaxID=161662 RepID=A0A6G1KTU3_9PEZI|nr:hypothetical protein EJ03DRAFT_57455 [Teratosphaeria nubilosa]